MMKLIERRLNALEGQKGIGYQPIRVICYHGHRREFERQVRADTNRAEANDELLLSVFFVPPDAKPR
jgi:hypothetical protein